MTFFVLATVRSTPPPGPSGPQDLRTFWLESWDGLTVIPIGGATHNGPVQLQVGASGLEVAPSDVAADAIPDVPGAVVVDAQTLVREPLLPLLINSADQAAQTVAVHQLREMTNPAYLTRDGSFRLVCASPSGTRQVGLAYRSGLEGSGTELPWAVRYVVDCFAPQPYAEDREETPREYSLGVDTGGFFAWDEADLTAPLFEDLTLGWDVILGEDMPLEITSEVPPYAVIEVVGPTGPGVVIEADTGLYLSVPAGVPGGSTLRIVTDPRRKSIRLDGEPAAGMLARGSRLRPLAFGQNLLSITAPGADADTRLRLSWRGLYRSLF